MASLLAVLGAPAKEPAGQPAPPWQVEHWINSKPLSLEGLKGQVVLVRWWTAPRCPYCAATAPALNEFHESYRGRGLQVIGFYHHKSPEPLVQDEVARHVRRFRFLFPVAIDTEWRTLKRWWLDSDSEQAKWTSVSFLIDRQGRIRHIHPGGEYPPGSGDYQVLRAKIEALLNEPE